MISNVIKGKDFTDQNFYVGIDTHHKSWMVSIYSEEFELKTFKGWCNIEILTLEAWYST